MIYPIADYMLFALRIEMNYQYTGLIEYVLEIIQMMINWYYLVVP